MKPIDLCPKCSGRLEQIVCSGIEVDRCLYCRGLWFDSLEAETLKTVQGSESLDIGNPQMGNNFNKISEDIDCPRCNQKMIRMVDIDLHCIWYEKCPACYGVWLDAGEFKNFKDNFKGKGIVGQAKKFFKRKRQ